MRSICIIQPYVPEYRVPFFEGLALALKKEQIKLSVVAGLPDKNQARRGDAAQPAWLKTVDFASAPLLGKRLVFDFSYRFWKGSNGVILPLMGSSLGVYQALLTRGAVRVGLWGHVAPYVAPGNRIDLMLESWQMRRVSRIFAYTQGGRDYAISKGIQANKITIVNNAIDTSAISRLRENLHQDDVQPYFAYIGGLDASKRIDLLADALHLLHKRGSRVRVKVAGLGTHSELLTPAVARGQVEMLGFVRGDQKAALLLGSRAVLVPGRIGLLAVEALAARRPILTTRSAFHAPEVEYLEEGKTMLSSGPTPEEYAQLLEDAFRVDGGRIEPKLEPDLPSMVKNFASGVSELLAAPGKH